MRKHISLTAAAALLVSLGALAPTAAQAAPITFDRVANKTVSAGGTVTVTPRIERDYGVKVVSKTVTAKQHGRLIARNKKSIKLGAGTYRVTTKVKYKVKNWNTGKFGKKKFKMKTYTLVITTKRSSSGGSGGTSSRYYKNCTEVRNAGADPLYRGDPGYGSHLDRDGDGIACE